MNNFDSIHFISLNTQGLRDLSKRERLKLWIKQQDAGICFLQETHFTEEIEHLINAEFSEWTCYHSFSKSNSRGVSILIKNVLVFSFLNSTIDTDGRYVLLNIEINNIT